MLHFDFIFSRYRAHGLNVLTFAHSRYNINKRPAPFPVNCAFFLCYFWLVIFYYNRIGLDARLDEKI